METKNESQFGERMSVEKFLSDTKSKNLDVWPRTDKPGYYYFATERTLGYVPKALGEKIDYINAHKAEIEAKKAKGEKLSDNEIRNLKIGDILVFNRENKIVVHRIYKIYSSGDEIFFKTKGDNNNAPDSYLIEIHEILGIVKLKVRYIGYPTVALYERINS